MGSIYKQKGQRHWYVSYQDENGDRIRKTSGTSDKSTAMQVLTSLEIKAAQKKIGVYSDQAERALHNKSIPIADHIAAYSKYLLAGDADQPHVTDETRKLHRLARECPWEDLQSITIETMTDWLSHNRNYADSTRKSYARVARSFTAWAAQHGKTMADSLALLPSGSIRKKTFERRALTESEWQRLRGYLETSLVVWRKLNGVDRAILYELSLVTGLRISEIQSLKISSLNLLGNRPHLRLRSSDSKNNKGSEPFLTKLLASRLAGYIQGKPRNSSLFILTDITRIATILRADCEGARNAWISEAKSDKERNGRIQSDFLSDTNDEGDVLDFHCLRHTCGAWLALRGIHPKAIQRVMRHSTITLTLDTYGHLFPEQEEAAIAAMELAANASQQ